jgi:hypothetical protein
VKTSSWSLIAIAPLAAAAALVTTASAPSSACASPAVPQPLAAVKIQPPSFRLDASVYDGRGGYNDAPLWRATLPLGETASITSRSCI